MSRRFLLWSIIAGAAAAGAITVAKNGQLAAIKNWLTQFSNKPQSYYSENRFEVDLFDQMNYARLAKKYPPLKLEPELQTYLDRYRELPIDDLNQITASVQNSLPRYYRVAVCTATRPALRDLLQDFHEFAHNTEKEMNSVGCYIKKTAGGLSNTCLLVVGQRLQDFSPEVLSERNAEAFFSTCPMCRHPHICKVAHQQHSLTLECPACKKSYAVVAADSHGRFRYVNEFLSGYQPPARFPKDQSRIQELFTIWSAVHAHCQYMNDPDKKKKQTDCWQTSMETQNLQRGDCEDSSIFLADWLMARGFQVRVALGRYGDLGGHAWCVVRLDGNDYLLESTEGRPDPSSPPLAELVGSRYVPEILFDRAAIYVRYNPKQTWSGDYWSTKAWVRIDPRAWVLTNNADGSPAAGDKPSQTQKSTRLLVDPSRLAFTTSPKPAAAPFAELENIPAGANTWQLPVEDPFNKLVPPAR